MSYPTRFCLIPTQCCRPALLLTANSPGGRAGTVGPVQLDCIIHAFTLDGVLGPKAAWQKLVEYSGCQIVVICRPDRQRRGLQPCMAANSAHLMIAVNGASLTDGGTGGIHRHGQVRSTVRRCSCSCCLT
eukprot:365331-Chlamydomonas_euryale.AAC.2